MSTEEKHKHETEWDEEEIERVLKKQDGRKVSAFEAAKLEKDAKKNWDLFYKRNETRFFKDRHWTLREFQEILDWKGSDPVAGPSLLEVGCGCGNFVVPLLEELKNLLVLACDFSPQAVQLVRQHEKYDQKRIKAFVCDVTVERCFEKVLVQEVTPISHVKVGNNVSQSLDDMSAGNRLVDVVTADSVTVTPLNYQLVIRAGVDFVSMIFVLSAISPVKYSQVISNLASVLKSGGVVFFRDYGRYDMAQLRFKGGNKIQDNFYVRRDGTRAYYFTPEEVKDLFCKESMFRVSQCEYIYRQTVNVKEKVDVRRVFIQGKFVKT